MVRYAAAAFALAITSLGLSAHGAEILMLDFWSPNCGPCMQMKPIMHSLEQANYPIREVDTTRDSQLSQQFHVGSIPCFVMLVDGHEVDREIGFTSSERLQQMFQKAKDVVVQQNRLRLQSPDTMAPAQSAPPMRGTAVGPAPRLDSGAAPGTFADTRPSANNPLAAPSNTFGSAAGPAAVNAGANTDFPPSLVAATVRIRVEDAQGKSCGTGTIVDSRSGEALIVTCGHLFRESKGHGPVTVEMFEAGPNGAQLVGAVPGQLISYDLNRDVALVSIRPNRQVAVVPVAPAHAAIKKGDRVATIGCSNGKDPTMLPERINMLDRYQGPANIEVSGTPEEGRSGGGLFNSQGQLIGICNAADYEGKEGIYAALDSVHDELDRLGLKDVYAKTDAQPQPNNNNLADPRFSQQPSLIRSQEPTDPLLQPNKMVSAPSPTSVVETSSDSKTAAPQNLNEPERAALDEITKRTASSEVICIIGPKTPGGQSEVITLDNASPEFVRALEARASVEQLKPHRHVEQSRLPWTALPAKSLLASLFALR